MAKHSIQNIEWLEVVWQRPFNENNVYEMLTHLATLENRGAIIWESRSHSGYVKHIIGAESKYMNKIAGAIKIHGDIAIYPLPAHTRVPMRTARRISITKPSYALNTNVIKEAPEASGAQYMEAITHAAELLSTKENACIIVIGSGLSDGGVLDFTSGLLDQDIDTTINNRASYIENMKSVYKTSDGKPIKIHWVGLGSVAAPQPVISGDTCEGNITCSSKVKSIYTRFFAGLGIYKEYFETEEPVEEAKKQKITTDYSVGITSINGKLASWDDSFSEGNESSVTFVGNSDIFVDSQKAIEEIKNSDTFKAIKDNKNVKVIITAHIARTNNCDANNDGKGNHLTIERGEKVRDTYLSLLPEDMKNSVEFEIIDGGFVVDNYECSNGIVDKTKQEQNRKVDVRVVKK